MKYVPLIVSQLEASAVQKILLVDDAYDPPSFPEGSAGELLELIDDDRFAAIAADHAVKADTIDRAKAALETNPAGNEDVQKVYKAVYFAWSKGRDAALDFGGHFAETKTGALEKLDGLTALLARCKELSVHKVGALDAKSVFSQVQPDILFMDYYLTIPDDLGDEKRDEIGEQRSIELVKDFLKQDPDMRPSVVLMSSEDVEAKTQEYRGQLDEMVLALRFGFLHKDGVRGGEEPKVDDASADLLLDTVQGFEFGRGLDQSLRKWRAGAEEALDKLNKELHDLDARDFAYLLRFRLQGEGGSFADYLEWFLGEALRGSVDDTVGWGSECFAKIGDPTSYELIEGGHPAPSDRIARLYHRLRFSMPNDRPRQRFKTGDIFVNADGTKIRAVISPDCDLVVRPNGRTSAKRLLTIGGDLRDMHDDGAFASELLVNEDEVTKAISWSFEDVATSTMTDTATICVDGASYKLFGTLRPLYANSVQTSALADLGRVGLAVAPPVYRVAKVKAYFVSDGNGKELSPARLEREPATILFARGGNEKDHKVLFTRSYVRALIAALQDIETGELPDDVSAQMSDFIKNSPKVAERMQRKGLQINEDGPYGSKVRKNRRKGSDWLQFVVILKDN